MKKIIIASLALVLSVNAFSQTSGVGIGAIVGSSFDFSAKFWVSENTAFALAAGLDFYAWGGFHVTGDYLIHQWGWDVGQDQMKVYLGPGIGFGFHSGYINNFSMNLRAASGVGYYFHNIPLECFVDVVPGADVFGPDGFYFRWSSYVGARWYF